MIKEIFVYDDYGCSEFSVQQLYKCFQSVYENKYKITKINAQDINENNVLEKTNGRPNTKLLCLGGGFDLGYIKSLKQEGINKIRDFVHSGGNYLGICAGAYFATDYVEFDLNGKLEVKGERCLKFFNGKSIGPVNKAFIYNSDDEAIAIRIKLADDSSSYCVYLNGGCYFEPYGLSNNLNDHQIVARYDFSNEKDKLHDSIKLQNDDYIAILETKFENGGKCLLSGVHFEFNLFDLDYISNQNVRQNLFDKLNNQNERVERHSNHDLVKYLLNKTFNL